jgi:GNAT superfamily N-acetyltransferase
MPDIYARPARVADIESMRQVERAAGTLFAGIGMDDVAADEPLSPGELARYIEDDRAWVAEVRRRVAGYILASVVDRCAHIEQVSVDPAHGRQGLGRMLLSTVEHWARFMGLGCVTLLTFRDVPWNGPYYASLGYRTLDDDALGPELHALRLHEAELGLDTSTRVAMRLEVGRP